MNIIDKIEAE
jgi:large subunit ribosomal protein L19